MARRRNSNFSKRSKNSRRKARRYSKLSKGMKRSVTRLIRREEETKCVQFTDSASISSYGSDVQAQGFVPLSPYATYCQIDQGVGQGERIGNKCRIVKATLSYVLRPNPYNATTNIAPLPQEVIIRIMSVKNTNELVAAAGNYFQAGDGSQSPTGNLLDIPKVVNTDLYTQYRMIRHKLGTSAYEGGVPNGTNQFYANNDFHYNAIKTIDVTKYCPKIIRFNDNTSTPSTRVLQTFIEAVNADGSTSAVNQVPVTMDYTVNLWYKDA